MDADGSGLQNVTDHPALDHSATWSSDGQRIAFESERDVGVGSPDLYTVRPDGTDVELLTTHVAADREPAWSPDGQHIAFRTDRDSPVLGLIVVNDIYVMDADGGSPRNLTHHPGGNYQPDWSPDGSQIVFTSTRDRSNWDIYVINADGTGVRRLTTYTNMDVWPTWSPDGTQIAFQSQRDGPYGIYIMDADGSNVRRVTQFPYGDLWPDWFDSDFATPISPLGKRPLTWGWLRQAWGTSP